METGEPTPTGTLSDRPYAAAGASIAVSGAVTTSASTFGAVVALLGVFTFVVGVAAVRHGAVALFGFELPVSERLASR